MNNDEIISAIVEELTIAYIALGRNISKENAIVVASSLHRALKFNDVDEVHGAFRRAKNIADIPTQRVLGEALTNHRAETTAYKSMPQRNVPAVGYDGAKLVKNDEVTYMKATQRLYGIYLEMDEATARQIVQDFEANPKNKSFVEYQKKWLRDNGTKYRLQTSRSCQMKAERDALNAERRETFKTKEKTK